MRGFRDGVVGALVMAGVSTVGDFIWAIWIPRHRWYFGLAHGTLLFLALGLYLGMRAGRARQGALGGAAIGCLAASSFYVLAPVAGYSAMFLVLPRRLDRARRVRESPGGIAARDCQRAGARAC